MSIWNDDNIAVLKKLWSEGLSASAIAVELGGGVTKNAVIGKVHRLGLSNSTSRPQRSAPKKSSQKTASRKTTISRPRRQAVKVAASRIDMMFERHFHTAPKDDFVLPETSHFGSDAVLHLGDGCKWPVGDPKHSDFRFCCAPRLDGLPYCEHHQRDAVRPSGRVQRVEPISMAS